MSAFSIEIIIPCADVVVIEIDCGGEVESASEERVLHYNLTSGINLVCHIVLGGIHHIVVEIADAVHHVGRCAHIGRKAHHVECPALYIV